MSSFESFSQAEQAILQARAARVAADTQSGGDQNALTVLLVSVHDEMYALPIEAIRAVHVDIPVMTVPCAPPFVAGIANIRGYVLPVIDLARLLDVPAPQRQAAPIGGLILASQEDMTIALLVNAIHDVAILPLDRLAPVPSTLARERLNYLQGVMPDGAILLDVAAILNDPALVVDETVG